MTSRSGDSRPSSDAPGLRESKRPAEVADQGEIRISETVRKQPKPFVGWLEKQFRQLNPAEPPWKWNRVMEECIRRRSSSSDLYHGGLDDVEGWGGEPKVNLSVLLKFPGGPEEELNSKWFIRSAKKKRDQKEPGETEEEEEDETEEMGPPAFSGPPLPSGQTIS